MYQNIIVRQITDREAGGNAGQGRNMPASPMNRVIEHLRTAVLRDSAEVGDGELLRRFIERRGEAALAALIKRHGPMVWGVCRRLLGHHDAEDAFQATFLVLVRKAASIVPREMVGNWLYGVAHQTALHARRTAARRSAREVQVTVMPDAAAAQADHWPDVGPLLDQELSRLPDIYRAVLVLCDLEGRTRKEVARQLGVPEGTVAGRLARARTLLAKRLTQRGVTLSGGALAALLAENVAAAGVPDAVVSSAIHVAAFFAAGRGAGGPVSVQIAALTEGMLKAMMMSKLKAVVVGVLVVGLLLTAAIALSGRAALAQAPAASGPRPPAPEGGEKVPKEKAEKAPFIAWGKEAGGLQAGLGIHPNRRQTYRHGETVALFVRIRNVGNETVKFAYIRQFMDENSPAVTDAAGKSIEQPRAEVTGLLHVPVEVSLAPGQEIDLESRIHGKSPLKYELRPERGGAATEESPLFVGRGKNSLQYEQVFGDSSAGRAKVDAALRNLGTGKLELEITSDPPADEKKPAQEKEVTAWGKEVGGLQAGLSIRPRRQTYRHGETIALIIRIRNVGKETMKFEYLRQFLDEAPPTVRDAAGKPIPHGGLAVLGIHVPAPVTLEPGKEIVVESRMRGTSGLMYELRPAGVGGAPTTKEWPLFVGTGKISLQYERVLADSSSGRIKLDPALSNLSTGRLELEIQPAPRGP